MSYQVIAAYWKAAEFAMQIQQEMLRPWVDTWLMAAAAAIGSGRAEPVRTMQERRPENNAVLDTQDESARTVEGARIPVRDEELPAHKRPAEPGQFRVRKEVPAFLAAPWRQRP